MGSPPRKKAPESVVRVVRTSIVSSSRTSIAAPAMPPPWLSTTAPVIPACSVCDNTILSSKTNRKMNCVNLPAKYFVFRMACKPTEDMSQRYDSDFKIWLEELEESMQKLFE